MTLNGIKPRSTSKQHRSIDFEKHKGDQCKHSHQLPRQQQLIDPENSNLQK